MSGSVHFGPLEIHDGKGRLQLCIHQRQALSCWGQAGNFELELSSVHLKHTNSEVNKDQLQLEIEAVDGELPQQGECFAQVHLNGFDYYFGFQAMGKMQIAVTTPVFRAEKRADERLLLFPAYNAFVYLVGKDDEGLANVVPLRKSSSFGIMEPKEFSLQLRIYDISSKALSIRVPQKNIQQVARDWNEPLNISIDGQAYKIQGLKHLYHVPMIEKRSSDETYEKVGFSFTSEDKALNNYIESKKSHTDTEQYRPLFEKFIKRV